MCKTMCLAKPDNDDSDDDDDADDSVRERSLSYNFLMK